MVHAEEPRLLKVDSKLPRKLFQLRKAKPYKIFASIYNCGENFDSPLLKVNNVVPLEITNWVRLTNPQKRRKPLYQ